MTIKTSDSKGRITFGPEFANKTFIVETSDSMEIRLVPAAIIPEREMWILRDKEKLASLELGLAQAKSRKFSKKPPTRKDLKPLGD